MEDAFLSFNNNNNVLLLCQTIIYYFILLFVVAPTEGTLPSKWGEIANNVILPYKVDAFPRTYSVVGPNGNNNNNNGDGQILEVIN